MEVEKIIKPPLTYYGGKQKLSAIIVEKIPPHNLYCEPFAGGAAVFFAKPPSHVEVINDTNSELINFYKVCKSQFAELQKAINETLHSREAHRWAKTVNDNPGHFDTVKRAWAIWVLAEQSYCSKLNGTFGYSLTKPNISRKLANKCKAFTNILTARLRTTQIECADALYVIKSRDTPESFFYCDPPYFNSDCGHYKGYKESDFKELLLTLSKIKGKFLLSSYPSPLLQSFSKKQGWHVWTKESGTSVNAKSGYLKRKVEVLTGNYLF